jgi:hypothetical protein
VLRDKRGSSTTYQNQGLEKTQMPEVVPSKLSQKLQLLGLMALIKSKKIQLIIGNGLYRI